MVAFVDSFLIYRALVVTGMLTKVLLTILADALYTLTPVLVVGDNRF